MIIITMKIHTPSQTIQTDKRAYSNGQYCYRVLSGGKAEPIADVVWSDFDIFPYENPVIGTDQKRTDTLVETAGVYTYEVVAKTQAELDAEAANQLQSDLQQATVASAILITEVFNQLKDSGYINVPTLSQEAKDQFASLSALVAQYQA